MDPARLLELHHLRHSVLATRLSGHVFIEFTTGLPAFHPTPEDARVQADELLALVNLPLLRARWNVADRDRAVAILAAVLHWDLETFRPTAPENAARLLATRIVDEFPKNATFLTNVRARADLNDSPHKWASGNEAVELDAGVAIISHELCGLVWVEDRPG